MKREIFFGQIEVGIESIRVGRKFQTFRILKKIVYTKEGIKDDVSKKMKLKPTEKIISVKPWEYQIFLGLSNPVY